jgi:hypothetical protein
MQRSIFRNDMFYNNLIVKMFLKYLKIVQILHNIKV